MTGGEGGSNSAKKMLMSYMTAPLGVFLDAFFVVISGCLFFVCFSCFVAVFLSVSRTVILGFPPLCACALFCCWLARWSLNGFSFWVSEILAMCLWPSGAEVVESAQMWAGATFRLCGVNLVPCRIFVGVRRRWNLSGCDFQFEQKPRWAHDIRHHLPTFHVAKYNRPRHPMLLWWSSWCRLERRVRMGWLDRVSLWCIGLPWSLDAA